MDAVVLAGSTNSGRLKEISPVEHEALIPIGERVMVDYVIAALSASRLVDRMVVVGPPELALLYGGREDMLFTAPGTTMMDSVRNGVGALKGTSLLLVATCDIPLITGEIVDAFVESCPGDVDLFYPVVEKSVNEERFPGVKRTYVKLREGTFTGGNLFLVRREVIPTCFARAEELVAKRKKPVALGRHIGLFFLLKLILHCLTLKEAEKKVSKILGLRGRVMICSYPEVGVDVDKPSDLELVRHVLAGEGM